MSTQTMPQLSTPPRLGMVNVLLGSGEMKMPVELHGENVEEGIFRDRQKTVELEVKRGPGRKLLAHVILRGTALATAANGVTMTYELEPKGRCWWFKKDVTILVNADPAVMVLPVAEDFTIDIKSTDIQFGDVTVEGRDGAKEKIPLYFKSTEAVIESATRLSHEPADVALAQSEAKHRVDNIKRWATRHGSHNYSRASGWEDVVEVRPPDLVAFEIIRILLSHVRLSSRTLGYFAVNAQGTRFANVLTASLKLFGLELVHGEPEDQDTILASSQGALRLLKDPAVVWAVYVGGFSMQFDKYRMHMTMLGEVESRDFEIVEAGCEVFGGESLAKGPLLELVRKHLAIAESESLYIARALHHGWQMGLRQNNIFLDKLRPERRDEVLDLQDRANELLDDIWRPLIEKIALDVYKLRQEGINVKIILGGGGSLGRVQQLLNTSLKRCGALANDGSYLEAELLGQTLEQLRSAGRRGLEEKRRIDGSRKPLITISRPTLGMHIGVVREVDDHFEFDTRANWGPETSLNQDDWRRFEFPRTRTIRLGYQGLNGDVHVCFEVHAAKGEACIDVSPDGPLFFKLRKADFYRLFHTLSTGQVPIRLQSNV